MERPGIGTGACTWGLAELLPAEATLTEAERETDRVSLR